MSQLTKAKAHRLRLILMALVFATGVMVPTLGTASPATAVGTYNNAAIADIALTKVGQNGGQCWTFVHNMVWQASGGTQNISAQSGNYFQHLEAAGGARITDINALSKGDIIQQGANGDHTFIVVYRVSGNNFRVVDSNHASNEVVMTYDRPVSLSDTQRAYRMGTVASPEHDVNSDGRADLVLVATGNPYPTGSGRLEAHALNGANGYSGWLGNWATAAGYGNSSTRYVMGDVNADGRSDLVLVATGPTGSGRLEAHALNGATGYSTWLGNWATAAGYISASDRVVMGDVNCDGRSDLVIVGTGPTGSGRLEAHVLDAATGFSTWYSHWATAGGYISQTDPVVMGDVNGDCRADLVVIASGVYGPTGSGRLEAHALSGATGYATYLGHWPTAAGYANTSTRFVMGDVNNDDRADLVLVATGNPLATGSGRLEAHALNGANGYSGWLGNWATAAGYGNDATQYVMGG